MAYDVCYELEDEIQLSKMTVADIIFVPYVLSTSVLQFS